IYQILHKIAQILKIYLEHKRLRLSKELNLRHRVTLSIISMLNRRRSQAMSDEQTHGERLQIMLSPEELTVLDDFRFKERMPSRAAAVRELLKRGLAAEGYALPAHV